MAEELKVGDRVRIKADAEGSDGVEHEGKVVLIYPGGILVEQPSALGGPLMSRWPYARKDLEKIED